MRLLGILFTLVLIILLYLFVFNYYLKNSPIFKDFIKEGIDMTNYKTIIESSKDRIKTINKKIEKSHNLIKMFP